MKAALYEGVGKIKLIDLPKPTAGPGQVVVKVKYCGICGTDIHSYKVDGVIAPGTVLGHETVGTVEEVGSGVEGFNIGDRVVVGPPGMCPEGCYFCRSGRPTLCVNGFLRTAGVGPGTQGGYAEYVLAHFPNRMLVKIPDKVSFEDAVLFDVLCTAYHGLRRSTFKAGQNAVVVGSGAIGLSMVLLLKMAGANHIIALNRSATKREHAFKLGADLVLNPNEESDLRETLSGLYGGVGPDVVFECAGNAQAVGTAVDICKPGGEVILLGTNPEPLATINEIQLGLFELDVKGSFAFNKDEIRTVLQFIEKGMIRPEGMLNKIVRLDDIVDTMAFLANTTEPVRYALMP